MKKLLIAFAAFAVCVVPLVGSAQRRERPPQLETITGQLTVRADGSVVWKRSKAHLFQLFGERSEFPGGDLLLLPDQKFLWEARDVSDLFPSLVSEAEIQSVINAPAGLDAKTTLTIYTKDGHYYLVILGDAATKALARGLLHGGFGQ